MKYSLKNRNNLISIKQHIEQCTLCTEHLPFPPTPVFALESQAKTLIIGQAPGIAAHESRQPFNDASGDRLRNWLGLNRAQFYHPDVAIMPMGLCFPGYKNGADAPPRKECAIQWHEKLLATIAPKVTLYVGRYAQQYYLPQYPSLTAAIKEYNTPNGSSYVLPHPSGRNNRFLAKLPEFTQQHVVWIQRQVALAMSAE